MKKLLFAVLLSFFVTFSANAAPALVSNTDRIIYDGQLTDRQKLEAVYSLLDDFIEQHNDVGFIAKNSLSTNQNRWYAYTAVFREKIKPLLNEKNRLQLAIRKAAFTDRQWAALSEDQKEEQFIILYGDKKVLRKLETTATAETLQQLKDIRFDQLNGSFVDPLVNFTGATWNGGNPQADPNSDFSISANTINVTTMLADIEAYFYGDYGANYFSTLNHLLEIDITVNEDRGYATVWGLSNGAFTQSEMNTANDGLYMYMYRTSHFLWLECEVQDTTDSSDLVGGTRYYLDVDRSDNTTTTYIYDDSDRTSLVDTISIVSSNTTYQYLIGVASRENATYSGRTVSGQIENFDLQLAAANVTVPLAPASLNLTDLGGVNIRANWSSSVNATYYLLAVDRVDYPTNYINFEVSYNGSLLTIDMTGFDNLDFDDYYFSLWACNNNGCSTSYTIATLGGDIMPLSHFLSLIPLAILLIVSMVWYGRGLLSLTMLAYAMTLGYIAVTEQWALLFFPIIAGCIVIGLLLFFFAMTKGDWL